MTAYEPKNLFQIPGSRSAAFAGGGLYGLSGDGEPPVSYTHLDVYKRQVLDIREGRHPVVEKMLEDQLFVPNDTYMDEGDDRVSIITGPNMAVSYTHLPS